MKDAVTKATTDHKQFEQQLKSHRKSFGDSLGDLQQRVTAFDVYDVIARRAEHAREVCFPGLLVPGMKTHVLVLRAVSSTCRSLPWYPMIDICGFRC